MFSTRFKTLMQREWMQHHFGWLVVMLTLPLIVLVAVPFGQIQMDGTLPPPTLLAAAVISMTTLAVFGVTFLVTSFQLSGLARRDTQDRTIEFWMSLPGSHTESILATVLMHTVFVLVLALGIGAAMGVLMSIAVLIKTVGFAALMEVSWWALLVAGAAGLARLAVGTLLFTLWLAPLFMILMAANAWLKRWGTPAIVAAVVIGGNVLDKLYGNPIVWDLLQAQFDGAGRAMLDANNQMRDGSILPEAMPQFISQFATWVIGDAGAALAQTASLHFIGGLLVAAACFGLVILYRRQAH
jgi:ABC-2 type transport system permease protein